MKSIIVALSVLGLVALQHASAAPSDKIDCTKLDEVLDDLGGAQGYTTLNDKYKLAVTEEEFSSRCKEMAEAIKTLRRYNKECYANSALTNQVFSAILRKRSEMNEAHCKLDTQLGKDALGSTKCISENALEQVRSAERRVILGSQVLHEANIPDKNLRLRNSCCSVIDGKRHFMEAVKEKCSKFNHIYSEYVDSYTSEAMGLICPAEKDLKCSELEHIKTDGVALKSKFFLAPTLKLVKSLEN